MTEPIPVRCPFCAGTGRQFWGSCTTIRFRCVPCNGTGKAVMTGGTASEVTTQEVTTKEGE